jgi:hypothetical protein
MSTLRLMPNYHRAPACAIGGIPPSIATSLLVSVDWDGEIDG